MDRISVAEIAQKFKNATNRLVLLDYDGTLVKHTSIPGSAVLPDRMTDIILKLVDSSRTKVIIITGRSHEDIDKFLNQIPVTIIAEHGAMIKEEGVWKSQTINNFTWKKDVIPVMNQVTELCPESYVEEKNFSVTWHYRNVEAEKGYRCSRELILRLNSVVLSHNLKILDGNKVVEIMTMETGKGRAVKLLSENNSFDFILSIGDDVTDEEMFDYFLHNSIAYTIKVGEGDTSARYKLNTTGDVASLLKQLTG